MSDRSRASAAAGRVSGASARVCRPTVSPGRRSGNRNHLDALGHLRLANAAQTLVCHPSMPVKSVLDLVAYAKSHDMSYASGGQGVPGHLAAEMFLAATGLRMTHIPYKGPTAALQHLMGGAAGGRGGLERGLRRSAGAA